MNITTPKISSGQPPCANGYILLISVIILGAIAASVAAALLYLGAADSKNAISHQWSERAKAAANACAEEALEQIRSNSGFVGSGSLSFNGGLCAYAVANTGGETRSIVASSTVGSVARRVSVAVSAINPMIVAVWREVP